jgi:hypothetical protein
MGSRKAISGGNLRFPPAHKGIMTIIVSKTGSSAQVVNRSEFPLERNLQEYIYDHPETIPVYELREDKRLLVAARELQTESGPIDAFGVDKEGDLYIVETKLYRNPDKRTVVAQALDYGASLWRHAEFSGLLSALDTAGQKQWKMTFRDKLSEFFSLDEEGVDDLTESMRKNLDEGNLKFVILMDKLEERLKDLVTYVNQNSQFDIYAVELDYYKHDIYEIVIPRIFGDEVKKDIKTRSSGRRWDWDRLKERLRELGEEEVTAAQQIIDWAGNNNVVLDWSTSQRGGFILCFYPKGKGGFYPFGVTGDGKITWNTPHQGNKSPSPFNEREERTEILKRLQAVKGATVDLDNVDGYGGLKLPLRVISNEEARREFFSVGSWIKEQLEVKP